VERRAGDNPHPGWRAPTRPELAATVDERTSHGRWGELPYKTIWTAHTILARAVCEHGRAFALLLRTTPTASLALDTQARTMVELAAQASWLMWPDVGGRARVARLHVLRRRTAIEHDRLGRHLGLDPDADNPATLAAIDTYAETLGLRYNHGPNGGWTGIEDQPNLGPTERVAWYMHQTGKTPKKAMYAYLRGAAHGELWRLTQGYRAVEMPPDQPARWEVRASRDFTATAAMVAVEATVYTGLFAFQLLGMNAATAELAALLPAAQRTLRTSTH